MKFKSKEEAALYFMRRFQEQDPELFDLPHPDLAKELHFNDYLALIVGDVGVHILSSLLEERTKTMARAVGEGATVFPSVRKLMRDGVLDMRSHIGPLAPLRLSVNEGRIVEIDDELDQFLAGARDQAATAPIETMRLPWPAAYFHFPRAGGGLRLTAAKVGASELLGGYITQLDVEAKAMPASRPFLSWAGEDGVLRCYEITLVGRPIRTVVDHGFHMFQFYVGPQMGNMSIGDVLALNIEMHKKAGTTTTTAAEEAEFPAGILHLAAAILYTGSEEAQRERPTKGFNVRSVEDPGTP